MNVATRDADGVRVVHPEGSRITAASGAEEFRQSLERAVKDGCLAIAVDLDGVEYADSSMMSGLISAFKSLNQQGGAVCLFNVGSALHEFFRQTVLDRLIEVCEDEKAAMDLFQDHPKMKRRGLRRWFSKE